MAVARAGPAEESAALVAGPWTHRDVSAGGLRFHVAELGTGPLVLLLHGFPEFWWTWRHQLVALADAGYRAVAPDLRGYGASDKPPRGYDAPTLASDIAGLVRSLGEDSAVLVGHDWGGYLAWCTAALHRPVVRRLIAISIPHPLRMRAALAGASGAQLAASRYLFGFQLPWWPERRLARHDAAHVEELLRRWGGPGFPDPQAAARYREGMRIPGVAHSALEYYRWSVRSQLRPDGQRFHHRLRAPITAPTLHLHGAADPCVLAASAAGSGRYVAAPYEWRLLNGLGHFPHEEAPDLLSAEILRWVKGD